MNSNAPPLVLLSLREVNELTETPPHDVVVYFPSELMQMEGAAKARYAGEHCFSWFRELYPQLSAFQCSALCRVFFAANDVVLSHNLSHKLWCLCRAVMSDVLCLYHL